MADQVVVIGGNAAGMSAASRAKRLDPRLDITVLEASHFFSYSICGLPYLVAGAIPDHETLLALKAEQLKGERALDVRVRTRVEAIHPGRRRVVCHDLAQDRHIELPFDHLVVATGYLPRVPKLAGTELRNVFTVSRLEDGIRIRHAVEAFGARRAVILGAGYVGLMMACALRRAGLSVIVVEKEQQVYSQVDADIAQLIQTAAEGAGVQLLLGSLAAGFGGRSNTLSHVEIDGKSCPVDLALIDTGIEPDTTLAVEAGIATGISGAIQVDPRGQTNLAGVFAAGNCAETKHLVSGRPVFSALATTASKQGRVVGENLAGERSIFPGTLETSVQGLFGLGVGRTGLTENAAGNEGFEADSVLISQPDRATYLRGDGKLFVKLVFEKRTGRLLGGQIVGGPEDAKRIDALAVAVTAGMSLADVSLLDLGYAPPMGTLWDPVQIAAHVGMRAGRNAGRKAL